MTDGTRPDPDILHQFESATRRLLSPGSPFETGEEEVLGEAMQVFRTRHRNFRQMLEQSQGFGQAEFLVFEDGRRDTFDDFHSAVLRGAHLLQAEFGLSKGDRVAICAQNGPGWVLTASAALAMGVVVVAFNSWWTTDEIRAALELTDPALVVVDERRRQALPAEWADRSVLDEAVVERIDSTIDPGGELAEVAEVAEDDPALLLFTSGTSGRPKAAVLTHRCLVGFVQLSAFIGARTVVLSGTPPDGEQVVRLAVFPMFHISGFGSFLGALSFGNKTVWPAGRFDPDRIIELSERESIGFWSGASTHISRLLASPRLEGFDGTRLRQVGIGGSASTPSLIERTEARFPHLEHTFSSGYGMTESGGLVSYASNDFLRMDPDCVGPPLPTIDVRIEREDGSSAAEGEVGVICVRSPIVMLGYWGSSPSGDGALLPGRWLRTEDYGKLVDGVLFVASRVRDLIIRGGENIYPAEIERCLEDHPDVAEAAVYGRDDEEFGQVVIASVFLRPGASVTDMDIRSYCAERLAYFKVPESVLVRPEPLPRNATGKVLKRVLQAEA